MEVIVDQTIEVTAPKVKKQMRNTPEYNRAYYLKNKGAKIHLDEFTCPCGYVGSRTHQARHEKTDRHKYKVLEIENKKLKGIVYEKVGDIMSRWLKD